MQVTTSRNEPEVFHPIIVQITINTYDDLLAVQSIVAHRRTLLKAVYNPQAWRYDQLEALLGTIEQQIKDYK